MKCEEGEVDRVMGQWKLESEKGHAIDLHFRIVLETSSTNSVLV